MQVTPNKMCVPSWWYLFQCRTTCWLSGIVM